MRTSSCLMAIFTVLFVCSAAAQAGAPAREGVCDELRNGGYSKGLYGLCVAYCEAGAANESVLNNYERKRREGDPPMPCLAAPAMPTCPCWTQEMLDLAGQSGDPVCNQGDTDEAIYLNFQVLSMELFEASIGSCAYLFDPNFFDPSDTPLSLELPVGAGEEDACRLDVAVLCGG